MTVYQWILTVASWLVCAAFGAVAFEAVVLLFLAARDVWRGWREYFEADECDRIKTGCWSGIVETLAMLCTRTAVHFRARWRNETLDAD